jgi:neutral trehalase
MTESSLTDELRALYAQRKELLKKFDLSKDDAESTRIWEALSAVERQKIAKWYFHHQKEQLEEIDRKIMNLKQCLGEK